ncbi:toxin CptA [Pseudomonas duriflava]|uniref:Toxin CptA n=1 Tax=Pseudomonas duriflava TaxID=459528 RepID=A0A562QRF2_9PSED|nr:toxin CptA [Pseudomonas duriflava]
MFALALVGLWLAAIPVWLSIVGTLFCMVHAGWYVPNGILFRNEQSPRRVRHDAEGWHLWSPQQGWQPVRLHRDSMALPLLIILRYRYPGQHWTRSVCIPADALAPEHHRRLRLRLRFARQRWAVPE